MIKFTPFVVVCVQSLILSTAKLQKGVNDCDVDVLKKERIKVSYTEQTQERRHRFCWSIPPRCSYTINVDKIRLRFEDHYVPVKSKGCCEGFEMKNNVSLSENSYPECEPHCEGKCKPYGVCKAPNECLCASGKRKSYCIKDDAIDSLATEKLHVNKLDNDTLAGTRHSLEESSEKQMEVPTHSLKSNHTNVVNLLWKGISNANKMELSMRSINESTIRKELSEGIVLYGEEDETQELLLGNETYELEGTLNGTYTPWEVEVHNLQEAENATLYSAAIAVSIALLIFIGVVLHTYRKRLWCVRRTASSLSIPAKGNDHSNCNSSSTDNRQKTCSLSSLEPCDLDEEPKSSEAKTEEPHKTS